MLRPKIKRMHSPFRTPGGKIVIGTTQRETGAEIDDDDQGTVWLLLTLMDGTRTVDQIADAAVLARPGLDRDSVCQAVGAIIEHGFVEDAAAGPPREFSPEELDRYSRNINYFSWIDTLPRPSPFVHQQRLKGSKVSILGLGGSGSSVALTLAAAGVGSILCADFDKVEESNLSRQLLYDEDHVGKPKVEAAVKRLNMLNSHIEATGREVRVESADDVIPLMEGRDLLMMCADTPRDRIQLIVNEAGLRTGVPWIVCAYAGPMLVVGTNVPFTTPCIECLKHHEELEEIRRNRDKKEFLFTTPIVQAVIAPTAGLTGCLGALEAIYFLTGLKPQTIGRNFHLNLLNYEHHYYYQWPFWPECPACGPSSPWRPKGAS